MERIVLNGPIPVNCYVIRRGIDCYIVDPGYEKDKIVDYIKTRGYQVRGILLTHGHFDHIGAINGFEVPVYLHEQEMEVLHNTMAEAPDFFGVQFDFTANQIDWVLINQTTELKLGQDKITVIHTPGHTQGGVCYQIGDELYVGDTLFKDSAGRWDFYTGNQQQLKQSVIELLESQPDSMRVYPGHGEPTDIGRERAANVCYRFWKRGKVFPD